jgi:hypothetical protein
MTNNCKHLRVGLRYIQLIPVNVSCATHVCSSFTPVTLVRFTRQLVLDHHKELHTARFRPYCLNDHRHSQHIKYVFSILLSRPVTSPDLWPDPLKLPMPFPTLSDVFPYCPTFSPTVRRFSLLPTYLSAPPLTSSNLRSPSRTSAHLSAPPTSALCAPMFSLKAPALCMFRTIPLSCRMLRTLNPMMLHAFHLRSTPFPLCPIQFPSHLSSMYVLDI